MYVYVQKKRELLSFIYAGAGSVEVYQLSVFADIFLPVRKAFALVRFDVVDRASFAGEKNAGLFLRDGDCVAVRHPYQIVTFERRGGHAEMFRRAANLCFGEKHKPFFSAAFAAPRAGECKSCFFREPVFFHNARAFVYLRRIFAHHHLRSRANNDNAPRKFFSTTVWQKILLAIL